MSHSPTRSAGLNALIARLDALGPRPGLDQIRSVLASAPLTRDDANPFVFEDGRRYRRARVIRREGYELLVITWLPGQESAPHDHGQSACAVRVVEGAATEVFWAIGEDALADPLMTRALPTGATIAGHDAAVHSLHNHAAETLVTVHLYAPPLGEFRQAAVRGETEGWVETARREPAPGTVGRSSDARFEEAPGEDVDPPTVCVIGGGYAGAVTAAHLLRRARTEQRALRVFLLERTGRIGEGVAYGTRDEAHLLNVPARNMSALAADPDHFLHWLEAEGLPCDPTTFAARRDYGRYIRHVLNEATREAHGFGVLTIRLDAARRLVRRPAGGFVVHLACGRSVAAEAVVLATGHRPPSDVFGARWVGSRERLIADPWRTHALTDILPDDPVVLVGSGLTAIDCALSLDLPRRSAPVWMISRRGWAPTAHQLGAALDLSESVKALLDAASPLTVLALVRWFREQLAEHGAEHWRGVVDALRPVTPAIWQALSPAERARFIRHVRPLWEVHRHRLAPAVAARVEAMRAAGTLRRMACRLHEARASETGVTLETKASRSGDKRVLEAAWVVNCTGPAPFRKDILDGALDSLASDGLLELDAFGLGVATTADGRVLDRGGQVQDDLIVTGTLRKARDWESTAVPELRQQAVTAADLAWRAATRG